MANRTVLVIEDDRALSDIIGYSKLKTVNAIGDSLGPTFTTKAVATPSPAATCPKLVRQKGLSTARSGIKGAPGRFGDGISKSG